MFRAIGEVSGLDRLAQEAPEILSFTEEDVIVPPEQQAATLSQIFGFLEQQRDEDEAPMTGFGFPPEGPAASEEAAPEGAAPDLPAPQGLALEDPESLPKRR